jgi:hypothetical protein
MLMVYIAKQRVVSVALAGTAIWHSSSIYTSVNSSSISNNCSPSGWYRHEEAVHATSILQQYWTVIINK